jgi:hypothetical protein
MAGGEVTSTSLSNTLSDSQSVYTWGVSRFDEIKNVDLQPAKAQSTGWY